MSPNQQDAVSEEVHFNFDKSFQEKIVQAMIMDKVWAAQFAEVVKVQYFQFAYLKLVADRYLAYQKSFKEFPSMELLKTLIVDELKSEKDMLVRQQIQAFLLKVLKNENLGDLPYVKEKSLDFCKRKSLEMALEKSVHLIATDNYESVVGVIKEALAAGMATNAGLSLNEDIAARYSENARHAIKTGIPALDDRTILNGGLGAGEIGTVIALSGHGKSHILTQFGAEALIQGKNVVHYSFELRERIVGIRYDSYLCSINSLECSSNIDKVQKMYEDNKETLGKLIIKEFPTRTASVVTLRNHIERLALTGFKPDLVIVDYSGIMRSTEKYDLPRMELQRVFEELRGFAQELNVPIWTATQSNKEAASADFIDMTNMAESYGQAHACDVILGFHRKAEQKSTGYGSLFIAKNRAGMDGIKYHTHIDCAQSRLKILTQQEVDELMPTDESNNNKSSFGGSRNQTKSFTNNSTQSPVERLKALYKEQQNNGTIKLSKAT